MSATEGELKSLRLSGKARERKRCQGWQDLHPRCLGEEFFSYLLLNLSPISS